MKRAHDDTAPPAPAKKPRGAAAQAATVALMNSILANPKGYPISASEDVVRKSLVDLATYARHLEEQLGVGSGAPAASPVAGSSKPAAAKAKARSQEDLEAAAEKLRKAAASGIKKQMTVSGPLPPSARVLKPVGGCRARLPVEAVVQDGHGEVVVRRNLYRAGGIRRADEPRGPTDIQDEEVHAGRIREVPG